MAASVDYGRSQSAEPQLFRASLPPHSEGRQSAVQRDNFLAGDLYGKSSGAEDAFVFKRKDLAPKSAEDELFSKGFAPKVGKVRMMASAQIGGGDAITTST